MKLQPLNIYIYLNIDKYVHKYICICVYVYMCLYIFEFQIVTSSKINATYKSILYFQLRRLLETIPQLM